MKPPDGEIFLGFDPGGIGKFGVALLSGGHLTGDVVGSAQDAFKWAERECDGQPPAAAGIDTLLHWSDGPGGWRPADKDLHQKYGRGVIAPAALWGAMVIGGMTLAMRLRDRWPTILLNETHPKVLLFALTGLRYRNNRSEVLRWFQNESGVPLPRELAGDPNDHGLDAAVSAWATREGWKRGWDDLAVHAPDLIFPIEKDVHYFWPKQGSAPDER